MRFDRMYPAMLILAAAVLAACNVGTAANSRLPEPKPEPVVSEVTYPDGVRRVTTAELEELMKEGKVFVVDVRNQDSYDAGHIPGSKLIPENEVKNRVDEVPRDKMIVTYCS